MVDLTPEAARGDDPQMARLDPNASRLRYRLERLMLTPVIRFCLRVVLPFALVFGAVTGWFSVEANRDAFNLMVADVRAAVEDRPEFQVKVMAIDGAGAAVSERIRAELPLDLPMSSFDLDLEAMQAKLRALDPVREARLRIRQGGVLQIDIEERIPAVLWRGAPGLVLLDAEGARVSLAQERADFAALPVIAGDILSPAELAGLRADDLQTSGAQALKTQARQKLRVAVSEALSLDAVAGPIRARVRGYERMGARRWDVVLDRDQRIMLPETGAVRAFERVIAMAMAPQVDMLARDVSHVDLRLARRPVLRMSEQATQEMWRIKRIEAGQ